MVTAIHAAQVSYQVPDLKLAEAFMTDFGLHKVEGSDENSLYMRGTGPQQHIYAAHKGPKQKFLGATIEVATRADLEELAAMDGSSEIYDSTEPGGGQVVSMRTPDGVEIRAIWGRAAAEPLPHHEPGLFNSISVKPRKNASIRHGVKPCDVVRLGHFVLHVSNHDETVKWFMDRFNFQPADYFGTPDGQVYGTMVRLDLGEEYVDHHFMLILQSTWVGVHHSSFEVVDLDDVMGAHDYLLSKGYQLDVGVGRHMLGSQVFDYWKDPFGFRLEHFTDGDTVNNQHKPSIFTGSASDTTQWGARPPEEFFA